MGWTLDVCGLDASGPTGEPLWIDAAIGPAASTDRTLVVSSGLHGVEGFFGSAVQLALLERWRVSPPTLRCVLLHALNPYGFAWLRRTDDQNVDLNRNFLLEGEAYAGCPPGYAELDPLLNPPRPSSRWDPLLLGLLPALARRGVSGVRRAVAVGQYDYPRGLFFGGAGPTPTRRVLEAALPGWIAGSSEVVHLDLHTGLGAWAEGKLLIDYPLTVGQRERLTRWFGPDAFATPESGGGAYRARGGLGRWCVQRGLARDYLFAYLEFGTFNGLRVLAGLRAENQAHHWARPSDAGTLRAKARLKESFCPSDSGWRSRAIARAVEFVTQAEQGLLTG